MFFFKPPEEITDVALYEAELIGITALVIVVGYLLYTWSKRRYGHEDKAISTG